MKILDRFFLREFLKALGACLLAFLLCMLVYDLYDNIFDFTQAGTPLVLILHYYLILIPAWLVQIMPISLLLALLYFLSDLSKHGELTAMRASGLDLFRLLGSFFAIGILMSGAMLALNLSWAPNALYAAKVLFETGTSQPKKQSGRIHGVTYRDVRGNRFWVIGMVDAVEQRATGIEVTQNDESQHNRLRISAASGIYREGYWTFERVILYDYTLPLSDPNSLRRMAVYEVRDFTESPAQFLAESRKTKRITTSELLESLRYASRLSPKQRALYSSELHSRMAFRLSNLVVFLIGVPFGVVRQRSSTFMAVVNALLVFFAYMMISQVFLVFGQSGRIPAWLAAWLPNILFGVAGLVMIRRIQ